jgi:hypothetical protein
MRRISAWLARHEPELDESYVNGARWVMSETAAALSQAKFERSPLRSSRGRS